MLDRTNLSSVAEMRSVAANKATFDAARQAAAGVRRAFSHWVDIGHGVVLARKMANAAGGGRTACARRFREIMTRERLGWVCDRRSEVSTIEKMMRHLPAIEAWRSTLSPELAQRFGSPQSVVNRCPALHADGKIKGPKVTPKVLSVRAMLHQPAAEIALLLHRRDPAKAAAISRAIAELMENVARPLRGWQAAAKRRSEAPTLGIIVNH